MAAVAIHGKVVAAQRLALQHYKLRSLCRVFHSLPVVDVSAFTEKGRSEPAAKKATALQLREVLRDVGFFYAVGHGVDPFLSNAILSEARNFFLKTPQSEKDRISIKMSQSGCRGYQHLGQNITQNHPDRHEGLDLMREIGPEHYLRQSTQGQESFALRELPHGDVNLWPSAHHHPQLRAVVEQYIASMLTLGDSIMQCIALSLGLPEQFFQKYTNDSFWVFRFIHYPVRSANGGESEVVGDGCGEHTDYGFLTMIISDEGLNGNAGGQSCLQVRNACGEWVDVLPLDGAFVMNIGDMLAAMTNGAYRSTPHRVRAPIHSGLGRVSVPFFFEPAYDVMCAPLVDVVDFAACGLDAGSGPPKFSPIVYGDHLYSKTSTNFAM